MKLYSLICYILLGSNEASSFLIPSSERNEIKSSSSTKTASLPLDTKIETSNLVLQTSALLLSGGGNVVNTSTDDDILGAAIAVGGITAIMGFLYGKVLGLSLETLWSTIPSLILEKTGTLNPAYFITGVCTLGGLIMGILSSKFNATFNIADFVSSFSSANGQTLPSSSIHLFPLLLLSLVTSTFGFSVGPEGKQLL